MHTWTFSLDEETQPIFRLGLHGLWRLLHHGENNPVYPEVVQSETLKWDLTDKTVQITFADVADLNKLMNCQMGGFKDGVGIPPGYEANPASGDFYVTTRAHLGVCGKHFFTKSPGVKRRSNSLSQKMKLSGLTHKPRKKGDTPTPVEQDVTLHRRASPEDAPALPNLKSKLNYGCIIHPGLSKWNDKAVEGSPKEYFLASFSCLAYIWTLSDENGSVGLGLDFDTFSKADVKHTLWSKSRLIKVSNDYKVTCWVFAAVLGLPDQTYPVIYHRPKTVVSSFRPHAARYGVDQIYNLLNTLLGGWDMQQYARSLGGIPIRSLGKEEEVTAFDIITGNLEFGRSWYVGLAPGATFQRKSGEGFSSWDVDTLNTIHLILGTAMEKQVAERMNRLFNSLVRYFYENSGRADKKAWGDARTAARKFAIATHLNRARTKEGILAALSAITIRSDYRVQFFPEELMWICEQAAIRPVEIQHFLIMACCLRKADAKKKGEAPTDNDPKVEEEEEDTDDDQMEMNNNRYSEESP